MRSELRAGKYKNKTVKEIAKMTNTRESSVRTAIYYLERKGYKNLYKKERGLKRDILEGKYKNKTIDEIAKSTGASKSSIYRVLRGSNNPEELYKPKITLTKVLEKGYLKDYTSAEITNLYDISEIDLRRKIAYVAKKRNVPKDSLYNNSKNKPRQGV